MAEEDVAPKDDDAESSGGIKGLITKITSSKKMMIIAGSGVLLLLIIIGGATYYFLSDDGPQEEVVTEEAAEGVDETAEGEKKNVFGIKKEKFEKVHIFPLKPFFLPIRLKNNEESGHFLLVTPNFRLSNSGLPGEINKKLPLIREKIYSILKREKFKDLTEKNTVTQEKIKKAARDRTNELLPVGTGVVKDVFFSQFVIK